MNEVPHSELEKWHYQAVRDNPQYQLEGMMNVLYEEMMMAMPVSNTHAVEERLDALENKEVVEIHRHYHTPYKKEQSKYD